MEVLGVEISVLVGESQYLYSGVHTQATTKVLVPRRALEVSFLGLLVSDLVAEALAAFDKAKALKDDEADDDDIDE